MRDRIQKVLKVDPSLDDQAIAKLLPDLNFIDDIVAQAAVIRTLMKNAGIELKKPRKKDSKSTQTYYLPKNLIAKVRKVADSQNIKASHLLEQILREWANDQKKKTELK